jgi:hypothetical protein
MTLTAVVCVSSLINSAVRFSTGESSVAIPILQLLCIPVSSGFLFADWRKWLADRSDAYSVGKHQPFLEFPNS